MASLQIEQFGDLVTLTLEKFVRNDYVSLLTDDVDHPAAKQLIKKSRMGSDAGSGDGGYQLNFKVRMKTANTYRHISPTTPDLAQMSNDFVSATVPFRKTEVGYAFLEEEGDFNVSPERLVDLIKAKEQGCDYDFIEGTESDFWAFPSASDSLAFYSLPYWCTKNATEGFNGGIPSGYSAVAGLSPTTWPRWNNYTGQYTTVSLDDMIAMARKMAERTGFTPPVAAVPDLGATGTGLSYFTNLTVRQKFENVADSRNDNLGPDVAKMDGMSLFRRAPIQWAPKLDNDTTDPFYQLNFNVFKTMIKKKWWQRRTVLAPYPGQRNQVAVFKDTYMNFVCYNRRLLGVLATGTTYPS